MAILISTSDNSSILVFHFYVTHFELLDYIELYLLFCSCRFAPSIEKDAKWAYKAYCGWVSARNCTAQMNGSDSRVSADLSSMTDEQMCFNLCRFILEVHKQNGDPSDSLYNLVLSLQHYIHSKGPKVKFLKDENLVQIKNCLDNCMKHLCSEGKFVKCEKADVITDELEEIL